MQHSPENTGMKQMEIINRLVELNNGSFHASKDDMEILKEAASYNDYLGINYYQSRFIRYYDGANVKRIFCMVADGSSFMDEWI